MKLIPSLLCLTCTVGSLALALDDTVKPQPSNAAGDEAVRHAGATVAAIKSLGAAPDARKIAMIVFKAVRSSPDSVLKIVGTAVRNSPRPAAAGIVTSAIAGVPDPWKKVTYRPRTGPDGPGPKPDDAGIPMTLAEAIVRAAFDAEPRLALADLQAAADGALRMDPATLLRELESPRRNSGVGDAGLSNYANEPLTTPKQPAVSR